DKLRDPNALQDWNTRYFAYNLVTIFKPPAANESAYRELVGIFVTKALESGCSNKLSDDDEGAGFCVLVASIPSAARYDSRVARLKHWETDVGYSADSTFAYQEIDELLQEDS